MIQMVQISGAQQPLRTMMLILMRENGEFVQVNKIYKLAEIFTK